MSNDGPGASSILEFWRMLELLNPQPLPSLTPQATSRDSRIVVGLTPSRPLPWEALRPPTPIGRQRRVWRHTVYLGLYSVQDTYDYLHRRFFDDQDSYDERPSTQSACAAILLDEYGRLLPDAIVLLLSGVGRWSPPGSGPVPPGLVERVHDGAKAVHGPGAACRDCASGARPIREPPPAGPLGSVGPPRRRPSFCRGRRDNRHRHG